MDTKRTIYAKQVPPEYQESPMEWNDEYENTGIIITGNRHFLGINGDDLKRIIDNVNECFYAYLNENGDITDPKETYPNMTSLLNDRLYRDDQKPYTTRQVHQWKVLLKYWDDEDDACIVGALSLVRGREYQSTTIHGCSQSDWNDLYYPADWTKEQRDMLEAEYFNTGSEWIVDDENEHDDEPDPEDIEGCSTYCYAWNTEGIRKEIAEVAGVDPEQVVLFEYTGSYSVPKYQIA